MMYESPVNLICKDYQTQIKENTDKLILEAIQEVGVQVDKTELIKAINYDRQQYEKGHIDGEKEVLNKIRAEIEKIASRYTISRERGTMGHVEWSDRLIKESEVLEIIDMYRDTER